jgi:hypothetical protein
LAAVALVVEKARAAARAAGRSDLEAAVLNMMVVVVLGRLPVGVGGVGLLVGDWECV